MALRNLIHGGNGKRTLTPAVREESSLVSLEHQMNQMMERFFRDFGLAPWSLSRLDAFTPRVNVSETQEEIVVTAELPGLEEKDIDVTLTRNSVILRGTKSADREEKEAEYHYMERSYGEFRRVIPLPSDVDADRAEARFRKGILTVTLPKVPTEGEGRKKIPIKGDE